MGYENAYDYEGGKQDWIEAGYLTESEDPSRKPPLTIGAVLTTPPPIARKGQHLN
jgi:hypothetical protein